ncbi:MAG: phosphoribosylformylglycinamidine synthase subunit PurL [Chitinophagales bacterium]
MKYNKVQIAIKPHLKDVVGEQIARKAKQFLGIDTGKVKSSKVFAIDYQKLSRFQLIGFIEYCLKDDIVNTLSINKLHYVSGYESYVSVAKLAGVTDDEGTSAQKLLVDFVNKNLDTKTQHIFSQELFYFENKLSETELKQIAESLLGNPLINHLQYGYAPNQLHIKDLFVPKVHLATDKTVNIINLNIPDEDLITLSQKMVLALNLEEMKAIQAHYEVNFTKVKRMVRKMDLQPTDCELEILAQTWSEHCKHKEFNAIIHYKNEETGEQKTIKSLFKTYIKGATDKVKTALEANGNKWLIKVFTDNAGVVKINEEAHFVWKVETHNSPSALDPYGGAITGILGNNRDPLGTGIGGGRLLFNTNVLCFGSPYFDGKLLMGQLHPRRIFSGVRHGIEDGGNKSGVPTVNGSIVFDDRYRGKPLVYCGTGAIMKPSYFGKNTWEKPIDADDYIVMLGGRVGKDGIHGATFSSVEIDEHSPMSAVQIGSPITQKLAMDFLIKACEAGLVKTSTDNGAGGLSSSIGELATISNGAVVWLEKVPLKYSGLKPWEIFVSESQERMTLVVEKEKYASLEKMATHFEVELSHIGNFTNNGLLDVRYEKQQVALLNMEFLHEGVPTKVMYAEWKKPDLTEPKMSDNLDYNDILLQLMGSLNICSRESVIRQYDHEVKGKTIIKPLMGPQGKAPQDAAVMRIGFDSYEGIAVSNGILPRYGDIDAYEMSAGAFDEAVRQIISVGGRLPNLSPADNIFWSVNDNFCVPDSEFHPTKNPDGKEKLAKLVQMCEALYDMATYFDIPLTSGKDSMKNDYKGDGVKISVPPTILYSMTAKIPDIRRTITSDFKAAGDLIYQVGATYDELGASEFYELFGELGANVPKVRKEDAKRCYTKMMEANEKGLIQSSHDLSDGGLSVALVESAFGGNLGANINLDNFLSKKQKNTNLTLNALLFAESHSRLLVTTTVAQQAEFEKLFGADATLLGSVTENKDIIIKHRSKTVVNLPVAPLLEAWNNGLLLSEKATV